MCMCEIGLMHCDSVRMFPANPFMSEDELAPLTFRRWLSAHTSLN